MQIRYCRPILLEWWKWISDLLKNKKNLDIIEKTYRVFKTFKDINIIHINSHTNKKDEHSYGNHIADQLARNALR